MPPSKGSAGLYPKSACKSYSRHHIPATHGHTLCVREFGSYAGVPVLYLHGGPGGGTPPTLPRLFDPDDVRLITLDQRGCGESTCIDRLAGNELDDLINDIELVRTLLHIDR